MGSGLIDQTEASIEEAMSTDGYADVTVSLLSVNFSDIKIKIGIVRKRGNLFCLT